MVRILSVAALALAAAPAALGAPAPAPSCTDAAGFDKGAESWFKSWQNWRPDASRSASFSFAPHSHHHRPTHSGSAPSGPAPTGAPSDLPSAFPTDVSSSAAPSATDVPSGAVPSATDVPSGAVPSATDVPSGAVPSVTDVPSSAVPSATDVPTSVPSSASAASSSSAAPSSNELPAARPSSFSSHSRATPTPTTSSSAAPKPTSTSTSATPAATSGSSALSSTQQEWLTAHNAVRAQHGANALTYSTDLEATAQAWANKCEWQHSGGQYGENLFAGSGTSGWTPDSAVDSWAAEASEYDPANPQYSHFTQVVWKSTTQVGCAIATCGSSFISGWSSATFMVCEYNPAGNVIGEFADNVQA